MIFCLTFFISFPAETGVKKDIAIRWNFDLDCFLLLFLHIYVFKVHTSHSKHCSARFQLYSKWQSTFDQNSWSLQWIRKILFSQYLGLTASKVSPCLHKTEIVPIDRTQIKFIQQYLKLKRLQDALQGRRN